MSANQRRSGFRLPWLTETDEPDEATTPADAAATSPSPPPASGAAADEAAPASETAPASEGAPASGAAAASAAVPPAEPPSTNGTASAAPSPTAQPGATPPAEGTPATAARPPGQQAGAEPPNGFIRDLVAAMRAVADEARTTGVDKLKSDAEEAVRVLEADAERRGQELRERAEADITGVGEWERAEAERIRSEAEQRIASRRAQLEQQIAAEGTRTEAEAKALRARVDDYERELEAFHAQLSEISDPAAFAAAAKRMPAPPDLTPHAASAPPSAAPTPPTASASATTAPGDASGAPDAGQAIPTQPPVSEVHPAEEVVLASRLAELDAELETASPTARPVPEGGAPVTTDVVVKGLGSFGAITGFRQSLSGQAGIDAVALSLGQNGEFVFRATHAPGFDLAGVITSMEGDGATVEPRPEGGLRVTLERSR